MRRLAALLAILVCAAAVGRAEAVLVIPFFNQNQTSTTDLDWMGESMAHAISEALASRNILVLTREDRHEGYRRLALRPYARLTLASILKIGEALDATGIIYGDFEFTPEPQDEQSPAEAAEGAPPAAAGNRLPPPVRGDLKIRALYMDSRQMRKGPEFTVAGRLEDLPKIQNQLAWQILQFLAREAVPGEDRFMVEHPPVRVDALESYIRGLMATTPEQKHRYFTQAVRLDEGFSQPCFQLGKFYWEKKEYRIAAGWLARVKPVDSNFVEANFLLGLSRYYISDFEGARSAFEMVAHSVPLNEVFNNLGAAQSRRNLPEALDNLEKALEGDPLDPDYNFNVGYVLWKRRQFEAAAERFRAALNRNSEDTEATVLLGRCLQKSGPRQGEPRSDGLERLKHNFEERAYRELKAQIEGGGRN